MQECCFFRQEVTGKDRFRIVSMRVWSDTMNLQKEGEIMRSKTISILVSMLALTAVCGCSSGSANRDAAAEGIRELQERGIPSERAGQKTAVLSLKNGLSSETLSLTENRKESDSGIAASVSSAQKSSSDRPTASDFDWVNQVNNIYDVPAGAAVLNSPKQIEGEWKAMLIGADNEYYWFNSILNLNFKISGTEDVTAVADWYRSSEINKQNGETKTYDESVDADTVYKGSMLNGTTYVFDPANDKYSRYLYVSGDRILSFFVVNWYEKGGRQYGLGIFSSEDNVLGTIALVRTTGAVPTPMPEPANIEWSAFEGYWVYENDNDPDDLWDDELNTIYIKAADPEYAFVHVDDEMWGEAIYDKKRIEYDSLNHTIRLYNIEEGTADSELQIDTFEGRDCLYVVGHSEMRFMRSETNERSWKTWESIEEDFRDLEDYYSKLN